MCVIAVLTAATIVLTRLAGAQAALPDTPTAFGVVFKAWAATHRIERGFIVVRRDGRIIHRTAIGGADPDAPVHIASLSKAITGACIAMLVRDGKLAFDTPVSAALAKFRSRGEAGGDPRFAHVTVAQLLTHRGGFGTGVADPASGPALVDYLKTSPASARPSPDFLHRVLNQRLVNDPGAKFAYSNTGYLALGAIIEEASGAGYAPYCRQAVLAPLAGDLEPSWRVLWSYAGWRMRAVDYLAFLDLFDTADQRLGSAVKSWMQDPAGRVGAGDPWYGLGLFLRKAGGGVNLQHFGSWTYKQAGMNAASRTSFLTLAVRQNDGTAWFVHVMPRPPRSDDERPGVELNRALLEAYSGVKTWK